MMTRATDQCLTWHSPGLRHEFHLAPANANGIGGIGQSHHDDFVMVAKIVPEQPHNEKSLRIITLDVHTLVGACHTVVEA